MAAAIGLDLAQGSGLSGGNVAGAHAVALDVVLAVLGGNVAGQHLQCALGGSVGGDSLAAQLAHHGADVDDLALALGNHIGQNSLGAVEGTANVHVDDAQEIGVAHLDHGHALHQTGVVHQNVHGAHFSLDLGDHGVHGSLIGNIGHIAVCVDAGSLVGGQSLFQAALVGAVEADGSAALCHALGNGEADAVCAAGDQGNLALQIKCSKIHK